MCSNSDIASQNFRSLDLIGRANNGDSDAFATLFHAHKKRIYSLCLRMTNNAAEAEELTQDTFLRVFRKLSSFRGDSTLGTWLHRIAVNTVLNHNRRKFPCLVVSFEELYSSDDDGTLILAEYRTRDSRLETSVTRVALTRAMSKLSESCRMIFLLHDVEGYQHHEIADLMGCTIGTSKSQLHRARLQIRSLLDRPREAWAEPGRDKRLSATLGKFQSGPGVEKRKLLGLDGLRA